MPMQTADREEHMSQDRSKTLTFTVPEDSIVSIGRYAFEGTAYFDAMADNQPVYIGKVF